MTASTATATASDLARLYEVPVGTIYRWAHTDGWRRTDPHHRPVRYDIADADLSYARYREAT